MAIYERIPSDGPRRRYRVSSPVTLEPIGEFEAGGVEDVRTAVARARKAQTAWAALSFEERAAPLWRLIDVIVERQDDLLDCVIRETGKPRNEAIATEVLAPCLQIAYYAKRAARFLRTERRRPSGLMRFSKKLKLVYQPLGVVGLITPWNAPVALTANPLAQALMAGNAVVHKPSEVTPFSAVLLREFTERAGFPADLYQVVQGDGETGAALIEAGVDKVSFTGSVATGRKVGEACGRLLIPVTLELGGKDAMIVCSDADLDRAAEGAVRGSCWNTGHYCCGTERVYVHEAVYEPFVQKVVERTRALRQSDREEADVGAVFWDRQLEIIESHVADARAKGARVLVGGQRDPGLKGLYFQPTVVVDVHHGMDLMRHETFGPVVAIQKVRDDDEAVALANDSEYGLSGNVWTRDRAKGERIAERIATGSVAVNDMSMTYGVAEAPFGGIKASGIGQVNGEIGIRGYCHLHPILSDRKASGKLQGGYPYTAESAERMQKFVRILFRSRILRRLLT
jgi:succinate-semialdehyde dehydrogenase/glutarate-semialdehyde dehydrogenase